MHERLERFAVNSGHHDNSLSFMYQALFCDLQLWPNARQESMVGHAKFSTLPKVCYSHLWHSCWKVDLFCCWYKSPTFTIQERSSQKSAATARQPGLDRAAPSKSVSTRPNPSRAVTPSRASPLPTVKGTLRTSPLPDNRRPSPNIQSRKATPLGGLSRHSPPRQPPQSQIQTQVRLIIPSIMMPILSRADHTMTERTALQVEFACYRRRSFHSIVHSLCKHLLAPNYHCIIAFFTLLVYFVWPSSDFWYAANITKPCLRELHV